MLPGLGSVRAVSLVVFAASLEAVILKTKATDTRLLTKNETAGHSR
jgi:hypothetical protein